VAGERPFFVRIKLRDGERVGGVFGEDSFATAYTSYAAGYPEEQDLYLAESVEVDPDTGEFVLDRDDTPVPRDSGILVRWSEVEYLEFIEA